tara:strand:+ start:2869 stop:3525 length:657 start_codon:yes stop_codon:yes gene_type:complete
MAEEKKHADGDLNGPPIEETDATRAADRAREALRRRADTEYGARIRKLQRERDAKMARDLAEQEKADAKIAREMALRMTGGERLRNRKPQGGIGGGGANAVRQRAAADYVTIQWWFNGKTYTTNTTMRELALRTITNYMEELIPRIPGDDRFHYHLTFAAQILLPDGRKPKLDNDKTFNNQGLGEFIVDNTIRVELKEDVLWANIVKTFMEKRVTLRL